jgi:hypothetical protein
LRACNLCKSSLWCRSKALPCWPSSCLTFWHTWCAMSLDCWQTWGKIGTVMLLWQTVYRRFKTCGIWHCNVEGVVLVS